MRRYPRYRTSPAGVELRATVHDEVDRCMDALEFGLDVSVARTRILDALSVYSCEVAARRFTSDKRRKTA